MKSNHHAQGGISRRLLLGAAAAFSSPLISGAAEPPPDPASPEARVLEAYQIRTEAAAIERDAPAVTQNANGDEDALPNRIGNYSKGLPHNQAGEVDPHAYEIFVNAMKAGGSQSDIEAVPMGSPDPALQRKFVNPCAGACFNLQGSDSHQLAIPAAPGVRSAQAAGEMIELYWQALARDVPFNMYDSHPVTQAAASELTKATDFRGPKSWGLVTTATLFRGFTPGDLAGPYLSQFLWRPIPFGAQYVEQRMRTVLPGIDFLTQYSDWLNSQNGATPNQGSQYDRTRRYIRNGRDLAEWVHVDVLYQAYFDAMLILTQPPDPSDDVTGGGLGAPLNIGNPYLQSRNQVGFGTFGPPAIAAAVAEIATYALKAVWYQKWFVHRRLRPEAYGGLVHNALSSTGPKYPLHGDVLNSDAAARVKTQNGSYLLPMAYPEGCPLHPSYGAGHATVAGAAVTILKALFDENYVIPNPMIPSSDGLSLIPYGGSDGARLTVGGELNKLASNIAIGRNFAGVHWRSDYQESLKLGEAVAISVLRDQRLTYREQFGGFTFTRFDGTKITV